MANRSMFFFRTTGSPSTNFNQGPFHVGTINKLLSVRVKGALYYGFSSFTIAGNLVDNPTVWGVQWGAHSYTPIPLPGGANDTHWLRIGGVVQHATNQFLDSAVSTANGEGYRQLDFEWHGQLPIGFDTDLYLTFTDVWGAGVTWVTGGSTEVIYV